MTIEVEVDRDGDRPQGRISDDTGTTREFAGWLGLMAALDTLISSVARATDPAEGPEPPPAERLGR